MGVAAASELDLPAGLLAELVAGLSAGTVLRPDRVAECRRRLAEGHHPDPGLVAEALVREVVRHSHPALR